jgi:hypothetical protein
LNLLIKLIFPYKKGVVLLYSPLPPTPPHTPLRIGEGYIHKLWMGITSTCERKRK